MGEDSGGMTERELKIHKIMTGLSDLMGVQIQFQELPEQQGRVIPAYDVNAIISKMVGFFVFTGLSVPGNFLPPYHRVHADVEWWKKQFEAVVADAQNPV